jgi:hypothetical protein
MLVKQVFKTTVSIGDDWAEADTGEPIFVGQQDPLNVEFWWETQPDDRMKTREFKVIGTGQPIEAGANYVGTSIDNRHGLVWHLYSREVNH